MMYVYVVTQIFKWVYMPYAVPIIEHIRQLHYTGQHFYSLDFVPFYADCNLTNLNLNATGALVNAPRIL